MAVAVGLHIDAHAIKAVVLKGNEKSAKVTNFVVERLDTGPGGVVGDIVTILNSIFEKHKVPRANVVASGRALDCVLRDVSVPVTDDAIIDRTIKFQAEQYFNSVSIEDFVIQYSKYGQTEKTSQLFVAGLKKASLEHRLGLLEEVNVDPVSVDLDVAALANTYIAAGVTREHSLVVVVDIESNHLRVAVIENGKLRTARSIRKRFGERKKVKKDSGESARLPVVILDDGEDEESFSLEDSGITSVERDSYLFGVFREIDKTVALSNTDESVGFICLTGNSCALPGIEEMFEEHFEVEVRKVDLAKIYQASRSQADLSLQASIPLGLALKGLGIDHVGMEFRMEEFAYQGKFEKLKRGLACTLCLAFVLCFLVAFSYKQELRVKKQRHSGVRKLQQHIYTVLFPNIDDPSTGLDYKEPEPRTRGNWLISTQAEYDRLANLFGGAMTEKAVKKSAIDVLKEFADLKQKCNAQVDITMARITQDQSRIHCVTPKQEASFILGGLMGKSEMFEARTERITKKDDHYEFDVVLKLKEKKEGEE